MRWNSKHMVPGQVVVMERFLFFPKRLSTAWLGPVWEWIWLEKAMWTRKFYGINSWFGVKQAWTDIEWTE